MRGEPCRRYSRRGFAVIEVTIPLTSRISGPMRRTEPLDTPTLLVNENGRLPSDRFAK
jgi:hypothetical protein